MKNKMKIIYWSIAIILSAMLVTMLIDNHQLLTNQQTIENNQLNENRLK
jgi:hypothetical protein